MENTLHPPKDKNRESKYLESVLKGALEGKNAHVSIHKALENLQVNITGKKILNTPYTIWQLLKHINYWQIKFLNRLEGNKDVLLLCNWQEGWEDELNASSQLELDMEIALLKDGISKALVILTSEGDATVIEQSYANKYEVLQAMASHVSYHLAEIILLRRIFGSWKRPVKGSYYGSYRV